MMLIVFPWFSHVSGRSGGAVERANGRANPPRAQASRSNQNCGKIMSGWGSQGRACALQVKTMWGAEGPASLYHFFAQARPQTISRHKCCAILVCYLISSVSLLFLLLSLLLLHFFISGLTWGSGQRGSGPIISFCFFFAYVILFSANITSIAQSISLGFCFFCFGLS